MHFFIRKKSHCYQMTHYFANVLYLSICMLGKCSCFYFSSADFLQNQIFRNKPPRTTISVSNSLDPDQDRHSVAKGYWQTTKLSTSMQRVITGKYFSVQYIVSYRDIHAYVYHKYSDTLNTFNMLCPLNKAKVIFKGFSQNQ